MRGRRRTTASPTVTSVIEELPPGGMEISGVLLAGDPARGRRTLEGITLVLTPSGVMVESPEMPAPSLFGWTGLDSVRCSEKTVLPDARSAAVLELRSNGHSVRFLLPADAISPGQAAYLEQAVPEWFTRYGASAPGAGATWAVEDAGAPTILQPAVSSQNGRPTPEPALASYRPTVAPTPTYRSESNGLAIPPPPAYDPQPAQQSLPGSNGLAIPPPPSFEPSAQSSWPTVPPPESPPPGRASQPAPNGLVVPPPLPYEPPQESYWPTVPPPPESSPAAHEPRYESYQPSVPPPPAFEPPPTSFGLTAPLPPANEPYQLTVPPPAPLSPRTAPPIGSPLESESGGHARPAGHVHRPVGHHRSQDTIHA